MKNKTIELSEQQIKDLCQSSGWIIENQGYSIVNKIYLGDTFQLIKSLNLNKKIDFIFADPPYNLNKSFDSNTFSKQSNNDYVSYTLTWLEPCLKYISDNGIIAICGDLYSTPLIQQAANTLKLELFNRITWERDKGRGSSKNWKNNIEDICLYIKSGANPKFYADRVKLLRQIKAPYKNASGENKDWFELEDGTQLRLTGASNIWTDLTVPFWSMPENTDHPTQKPEKLLAKLILAHTDENDLIFDPFAGSGTTAVVASKLNRIFFAIEQSEYYCALGAYRLNMAKNNKNIQGLENGYFLDRHTTLTKKQFDLLKKVLS